MFLGLDTLIQRSVAGSLQVGAKNALEVVQLNYARVQDDDRITALNVPAVMEKAKKSKEKLESTEQTLNSWQCSEYDDKRAECECDIVDFKKNLQLLIEYNDSLELVKKDLLEQEQKRKRQKRTARGRCAGLFLAGHVPRGFADGIVTHYANDEDEETPDPQQSPRLPPLSPTMPADAGFTLDTGFVAPMMLQYGDDSKKTYYHQYLNEVYRDSRDEVRKLFAMAVRALLKVNKAHLYKCLAPKPLVCNAPGDSKSSGDVIFDTVADLTPVLYVVGPYSYLRRRATPRSNF